VRLSKINFVNFRKSPGQKLFLKKGYIERPYIDIYETIIEITVEECLIIGYSHITFDTLYFQLIPEQDINIELDKNEILYIMTIVKNK
jgi:hypothetical protein